MEPPPPLLPKVITLVKLTRLDPAVWPRVTGAHRQPSLNPVTSEIAAVLFSKTEGEAFVPGKLGCLGSLLLASGRATVFHKPQAHTVLWSKPGSFSPDCKWPEHPILSKDKTTPRK